MTAAGQAPKAGAQEPPRLEKKVSMKVARRAALKAAPGHIRSSELEYENQLWVYSFDIAGKDGKIHEVQIDAKTGALAGQKIETAVDEAAEKKMDASEKKAKEAKP